MALIKTRTGLDRPDCAPDVVVIACQYANRVEEPSSIVSEHSDLCQVFLVSCVRTLSVAFDISLQGNDKMIKIASITGPYI